MTDPGAGLGTDLGCGHWIRWVSWSPDRDLNPQFAGFPDVDRAMGIIRHPLLPGDPDPGCQQAGYCEGVITIDGPVTRQLLFAKHPMWQMTSEQPLTLSPSLLCHCGDHGMITQGKWIPC